MGELVDVEEVGEENKNKPEWQFGFKEVEGRKRRMLKERERSTLLMCCMRSLCDTVPAVCNGMSWVKPSQERGKDARYR